MIALTWTPVRSSVGQMTPKNIDGLAEGLPRTIVTHQCLLDQHYSFARLIGNPAPQSYAKDLMARGVSPCFMVNDSEEDKTQATPEEVEGRIRPIHIQRYAEIFTLLVLCKGECHVYGLRKRIEETSQGAMSISISAIHVAMQTLLSKQYAQFVRAENSSTGRPPKKVYAVTDQGIKYAEHVRRVLLRMID